MFSTIKELELAALNIRKDLLRLCSMQVIHIGGDLSITDVMTVLWQYQINYNTKDVKDPERDRFVLSKGHASAVTSFNQAAIGCFDKEEIFKEYASNTGRYSMHSCNILNPYVEVSTGSLGHGFPIACGIAAALRLKKNNKSRVYVVMGDGEQSEGSIWEAAMNAVHKKLGNIIAIVDNNGLEADGKITEVTALDSIAEKYRAFGWNVCEFDGNDIQTIKAQFDNLPPPSSDTPTAFICHTVKGKGIPVMENQVRWHAGKISAEEYEMYIKYLTNEFEKKRGNSYAT